MLLVSCCRLSLAVDPVASPAPAAMALPAPDASGNYVGPAATANYGLDSSTTPSLRALPVNPGDNGTDASTHRKFYTLTASLREAYDTIPARETNNSNSHASFDTSVDTPSVLVDFPTPDGDFSGRYTFDATYFTNYNVGQNNGNGSANSGNGNGSSVQLSHELVAQYSHSFSDRFQLGLAEQFRYFTEPSILESTGTNYQSGAYISNTLNGSLGAQWTPLISTTTTFANTIVRYDDEAVAI